MLKERLQKGIEMEMEGQKGNGLSVAVMLNAHYCSWRLWFRMRSRSSRSSQKIRQCKEMNL